MTLFSGNLYFRFITYPVSISRVDSMYAISSVDILSLHNFMKGDTGGKVYVFGCDSICHCGKKKKVPMNKFLILNVCRESAVWVSRPNCIRVLFLCFCEEGSLQKKGGYMRRIACSRGRRCSPHKETRRSTRANKTRTSHTSCKMHWSWRLDFRTFIVNCNEFVT